MAFAWLVAVVLNTEDAEDTERKRRMRIATGKHDG